MPVPDRYMPGYTPRIVSFMTRRSAETHAAFFLPHLQPGMRLLDCGCGPGTITRGLAARVTPGEAVGIDLEASQLELARAEPGSPANLHYVQAGIYALPFPDAYFDAVFSHAVFEHIAEPVRAAGEIHRVLKPGGVAGLCSPDWDGFIFAPEEENLLAATKLFRRIQEAQGGDTRAGRHLGGWLREAGFSAVKVSARYECQEDLHVMGDFLCDRLERAPQQDDIYARGWADAAALEKMLQAIRAWEKQPDGLFALAWVQAVARR
ncbi:MAG TPA: methyltransferase domain-containing protein [Opitutales bacterium]|nr:methyltransferase domain-containing protein [Opitutales bacterium]